MKLLYTLSWVFAVTLVMGIEFRSARIVSRVFLSAIVWSLHIAGSAVLWVLGIFICGAGSLFPSLRGYRYVPRFGRRLRVWWPSWMWLWGNDEDGIDGLGKGLSGLWYRESMSWSDTVKCFVWTALRNPVNNLKYVPGVSIVPYDGVGVDGIHSKVAPEGSGTANAWSFTWLGAYTSLWVKLWGYQIRIGWRLLIGDHALDLNDPRRKGNGFALQFGKAS